MGSGKSDNADFPVLFEILDDSVPPVRGTEQHILVHEAEDIPFRPLDAFIIGRENGIFLLGIIYENQLMFTADGLQDVVIQLLGNFTIPGTDNNGNHLNNCLIRFTLSTGFRIAFPIR